MHPTVGSGSANIYFDLVSKYWVESTCVRLMWSTIECEYVSHCIVPLHRHISKNSTLYFFISKTSNPLIFFQAVANKYPSLFLPSINLLFRISWSQRSRLAFWIARGCLTWPTFRWGWRWGCFCVDHGGWYHRSMVFWLHWIFYCQSHRNLFWFWTIDC